MKHVPIFRILIMIICAYLLFSTAYAADVKGGTTTFLEFDVEESVFQSDGKPVSMDTPITVDHGQIFIPVHYITNAFGYKLSKNQTDQQFIISKGLQTVMFSIGSKQAYVRERSKNVEVRLEAAPKCVGEYILVPVQFFKACMHCQVYQDRTVKKILIASVSPGGQRIGADAMMSYLEKNEKGDSGIAVAVIDTGVDVNHLYLQNRIVQAYNATDGSRDVQDFRGHGTMVAGIIANCTPETVKIMPIKTESKCEDIARAIEYAVKKGASVINISLSASVKRDNHMVEEAVAEAVRQGCSVVVAAGNDRGDVKNYTPANVNSAIVVTALNNDDLLYKESNYGKTVVVSAPGSEIISTMPNGDYGSNSGTSFAAPYVAAAVALIQMDIPGITPEEILNLLRDYSRDLGKSGWDEQYGGGCVDLAQYVTFRENGIIGDLTKSIEARNAELDKYIEIFRKERVDEHLKLYGIFNRQVFAAELGAEAARLYDAGDCYAAGYYLEKANGVAENSINQNNLAYMLRRGEYISSTYSIRRLLDQAKAVGEPCAYINDALLKATYGDWEAADQVIGELCQKKIDFNGFFDVSNPWKKMSYHEDAEGDLVIGWLMRYGVYTDERFTQQELMERALAKYPTLPQWMTRSASVIGG